MANNGMSPTPSELGLPPFPSMPPGVLPPNAGEFPLAHFETFAAIQNFANRSYRWNWDQALEQSYEMAIAMALDPVIWGATRKRQIPTTQLEWNLVPQDKTDPSQLDAAEHLTKIVKRISDFQQLKRNLLDALFYGRYGVQFNTRWDFIGTEKILSVNQWVPVNGDKIVFHWDGTPGILVNGAACTKEVTATDRGLCHFLTQEEQQCFLVHKFEPQDADFWRSWEGAQIMGVGFRSKLFWFFWLRQQLVNIWFDFMQKVGTGFTVFYYELGNRASQQAVLNAIANQPSQNVLVYPRAKDGTTAYGAGVERKEVSMSGADMFFRIYEMLNETMTDYILGETLTTGTAGTGMGSGVAQAHESTAERRTKYDAVDLDTALQPLINTLNRWNCPGNPPPFFKHIVDKPNVVELLEAVDFFVNLGGSVGADFLRDVLGIPSPEEGEEVLTKIGPLQPSAVNMVPQEMPIAGSPQPSQGVNPHGQVQPQSQANGQQVPQQSPMQQARDIYARVRLAAANDRSFAEKFPQMAYRLARKRGLPVPNGKQH